MPETACSSTSHDGTPLLRSGRRSWLRFAVFAGVGGLLLVIALKVGHVFLCHNFHVVIPDRVYRCAQPTPEELERMVQAHGIRTVINLRGCCEPISWYLDECRTTHRLNVAQEDITLSAHRYPSVAELRRLVEVFDHADYPVLIHCRHGADRTGLAVVVFMLLRPDGTLGEARKHLSPRYGHLSLGRAGFLDQFLDLYAGWLQERGIAHSNAAFRQWLADDASPGECRCVLEPLDFLKSVPRGESVAFRVRATNAGKKPWQLRRDNNAGIHASFTICDEEGQGILTGKAGLFNAEVPPGQSIDLTLAIPPLSKPGRYHLIVDMLEENHCYFYQSGSELLEWEIIVKDEG